MTHFVVYPGVVTYPPSDSNQIDEDYFYFLVGQINRRIMKKAVCSITHPEFNKTGYYLISSW